MNKIALIALGLIAGVAQATSTYYVDASRPNDSGGGTSWGTAKKTIQAAVDTSSAGDTIVVTNGVYEPIVATNQTITIQSVKGADVTIIDGGGTNRCATLGGTAAGQTNSVLHGFTLCNGAAPWNAGAQGGTLVDCVVSGNVATASDSHGGGTGNSNLSRCRVANNSAVLCGGGVNQGHLENCVIIGNTARNGGGAGNATLVNCTVASNRTTSVNGGGVWYSTVYNSIVWDNTDSQGRTNNVAQSGDSITVFYSSCTFPSRAGVAIAVDPLFLDVTGGDFRLSPASPCIDRGANGSAPTGVDFAGNTRIQGGSADIGAYEYGVAQIGGFQNADWKYFPDTGVITDGQYPWEGGAWVFSVEPTETDVPGLQETFVSGYQNWTVEPEENLDKIYLTTRMAHISTEWTDKETVIYTGTLWNRAATNVTWTFGMYFDDDVRLTIDGVTTLHLYGSFYMRTVTLTPGPHEIDFRFTENTGIAGPYNESNAYSPTMGGFGIDFSGRNTANSAYFKKFEDPGDGSLLTTRIQRNSLAITGVLQSPPPESSDGFPNGIYPVLNLRGTVAASNDLFKITSITDGGLRNIEVMSLSFPDTLLEIGSSACLGLKVGGYDGNSNAVQGRVHVPDSVVRLGGLAFASGMIPWLSVPSTGVQIEIQAFQSSGGAVVFRGGYPGGTHGTLFGIGGDFYIYQQFASEWAQYLSDGSFETEDATLAGGASLAILDYDPEVPIPHPDLTVTTFIAPGNAVTGRTIQVVWTVKNAGETAVVVPFAEDVCLTADGTYAGRVASWRFEHTGGLAAGASVTFTNTVTLPHELAGNYQWLVRTDAGEALAETNESNNVHVGSAFTIAPPLVIMSELPDAMEMVPYFEQLTAIGGVPPYRWETVASEYSEQRQDNSYAEIGNRTGWSSDDDCWSLELPFAFPFYGKNRSMVYVSNNGTISFDSPFSGYTPELNTLKNTPMIAVAWADLNYGDIYMMSSSEAVTIRWVKSYYSGSGTVNASATLSRDGTVTLRYGADNPSIGYIGISAGDGNNYLTTQASGAMPFARDIVYTPQRLPQGLVLGENGLLSGVPTDAGTTALNLVVTDTLGWTTNAIVMLVIDPNANLRPVISSMTPSTSNVIDVAVGAMQTFLVSACDPEGPMLNPLRYFWTLGEVPVADCPGSLDGFSDYTFMPAVTNHGIHELVCMVSDDLWTNVVKAVWLVRVTMTHHVDAANGDDARDGASWATSVQSIQTAIDRAIDGDTVLVTDGVYLSISTADKAITIESVNGAEHTIIDGGGVSRCATMGEASGHSNTILTGFTLTNGGINGYGGGASCGTLNNCILTENTAQRGGGAYRSTLNNCVVADNTATATYGGGAYDSILNNCAVFGNRAPSGYGGGTAGGRLNHCTLSENMAGSGGGTHNTTLSHCILSENTATSYGGGAYGGSLNHCTLMNNTAQRGGGLLECTLNNCILSGNMAAEYGGGAYFGTLNNCTLSGNTASYDGGGSYNGTLNNCIVWGNHVTSGTSTNYYGGTLRYTCTFPLATGAGNIADDPCLVQTEDGTWRLLPDSPCLDAGNNSYVVDVLDLAGNPRILNNVVDMGAYEGAYEPAVQESILQVVSGYDAGSPVPGIGSHVFTNGTLVAASVTAGSVTLSDRIVACTGWMGAGSVPALGSGTEVTFAINEDSTLAWLWTNTAYRVTFDLSPHGSRSGGGALEQWIAPGDAATAPLVNVQAGWVLTGWDTNFSNVTNPLAVRAVYGEWRPDLVVSAVSMPETTTAGDTVAVTWTLSNTGNAPFMGSMQERVYLVQGGTSVLLATVPFTQALEAGASMERGTEITLPLTGREGVWQIRVDTAVSITVPETSGNNSTVSSGTLTINEAMLPDLAVLAITPPQRLTPGENVTFTYAVSNGGPVTASAPWTERIYLSVDAAAGSDILLYSFRVTNGLDAADMVIRTAEVAVPQVLGISGTAWVVVAVDTADEVTEKDVLPNQLVAEQAAEVDALLTLTVPTTTVTEGSVSTLRGIIQRSGSAAAALNVSLTSTRPFDLGVPASVTIPAGAFSASFNVTVYDNDLLDGTRTVTLGATATGYPAASAAMTMQDNEQPALTVELAENVAQEGQVVNGTITRGSAADTALTVWLTSSSSRLTVPTSVTIPAGQTSAPFTGTAASNTIPDQDVDVTIRANAQGYVAGSAVLTVLDDDIPDMTLELLPEMVSEGAGLQACIAELTRWDDATGQVRVQLAASVANTLILPSEVVFNAGQHTVTFPVGTVDNAVVDGTRDVTITASVMVDSCGCAGTPSGGVPVTAVLTVTDDDVPALKVVATPATMKEGLADAGTLRISHNTVLAAPLTVLITLDLDGEAVVPDTAVIPTGATHVDVPVQTLDDGVVDGSQIVTVAVEADGFVPGTGWFMVSDQNLPDFVVATVSAPVSGITGGATDITVTISNVGFRDAQAGVPVEIHCVSGTRTDGTNTLVATVVTPSVLEQETGTAVLTASILLPVQPGEYRIIAMVNPEHGFSELNTANNTGMSEPFTLNPSYTAVAETTVETALDTDTVAITGLATLVDGVTPAAGVDVEVYVMVNGFRRIITARTDAAGAFSAEFQPLKGEAGHYTIGACYPGLDATAAQDSFNILGMERIDSNHVIWDMTVGDTLDTSIGIRNRSQIALTGLQAELLDAPPNIDVTMQLPDTLPGGGVMQIVCNVDATDVSEGNDYTKIRLLVTSTEGVEMEIPCFYYAQSLQALLKVEPTRLDSTMLRDETVYVEFTVWNAGEGESGEITVQSPVDWIKVVGGATIPNLTNNAAVTVTLALCPDVSIPFNAPVTGTLAINCANGSGLTLPFRFTAVAETTGSILFDVTDDYTYYLAGAPHVSNATVVVRNPFTGEVVAEGITDETGVWQTGDLATGTYTVSVSAERHGQKQVVVEVKPGRVSKESVFLPYQAISYSWDVRRVEIEDQYEITLVTEYAVNVPAPVVLIHVPDELPNLAPGEEFVFNVVFENKGLVAAQNIQPSFPEGYNVVFEVLVCDLSVLPAMSSITAPVRMTRLVEPQFSLMDVTPQPWMHDLPCMFGIIALVEHYCGQEYIQQVVQSDNIMIAGFLCDMIWQLFGSIGSGTSPGRGGIPSRGGSGAALAVFDNLNGTPVRSLDCKCGINLANELAGLVGSDNISDLAGLTCALVECLYGSCASSVCKEINLLMQDTPSLDDVRDFYETALECITNQVDASAANQPFAFQTLGSESSSLQQVFKAETVAETLMHYVWGFFFAMLQIESEDSETIAMYDEFAQEMGYKDAEDWYNQAMAYLDEYTKGENDSVCAEVSLKFSQTVSITREAFEGTLTLFNGNETTAMTNVRLDLVVTDEEGVECNHLFGITNPGVDTLTAIDGTGELAPNTSGTATILFVPTHEAAPIESRFYRFGGTLSYTDPFSGQQATIILFPVQMEVRPSPRLDLHYFLQREVCGDDPLTEEIEPSIPAEFALMVVNKGYGTAKNMRVDSAQPEIFENAKGLLIDFELKNFYFEQPAVNGQPSTDGLHQVNLGNIAPFSTAHAQWWLTSSLWGRFTGMKASFTQLNDWGNPNTCLLDSVNIHKLVRSIVADSDGLPDFLTSEFAANGLPDTLWLSDGTMDDVWPANAVAQGTASGATPQVTVVLTATGSGWQYAALTDPGLGAYEIVEVRRLLDNSLVPLRNVWLTDRTFPDSGDPVYEKKMHIVDRASTAGSHSYSVTLKALDENPLEVVSFEGLPESPVTLSAVPWVDVVFNKPVDIATFTTADLTLSHQGTSVVSLAGITIQATDDPLRYRIGNLGGLTDAEGYYHLVVQAHGINDIFGNHGNVGKEVGWTMASTRPAILSIGGLEDGAVVGAVDSITVTFTCPVMAGSFTPSAIRIQGQPASGLGVATLGGAGNVFAVNGISSALSADGVYTLAIDTSAIANTGGETGNTVATLTWTLDTTPPEVVALERETAQASLSGDYRLVARFSEPVANGSVSVANLALFKGGTPVAAASLAQAVSVVRVSETEYAFAGLAALASADGLYEARFTATEVTDLAGNTGAGTAGTTWQVKTTPPAVLTDLAITPVTGMTTNGVIHTSLLAFTASATLPEDDLTVTVLVQHGDGSSTALTTTTPSTRAFTVPVTLPSPGNATLVVRCTDAFGNSTDSTLALFVDAIPLDVTITGAPEPQDVVTDGLTLTFSEAIIASELTTSELELSLDGIPCALPGVTITALSGTQFRMDGLEPLTQEEGEYRFTVALSQLHKTLSGKSGEGTRSIQWTRATPDTTPPEVVRITINGAEPQPIYAYDDISHITIQFSEPVNIPELRENGWLAQAVRLICHDAEGFAIDALATAPSDFTWNEGTCELTLQVNAILPGGTKSVYVDAGFITDLAGNALACEEPTTCTSLGLPLYNAPASFQNITVNAYAIPLWYDFDNDGLPDLLVGEKTSASPGKVRVYLNQGTAGNPLFPSYTYLVANGVELEVPASGCQGISVCFLDMTGNGVEDLVAGRSDGTVWLHPATEVEGVRSFGAGISIWQGVDGVATSARAVLCAADINGDGTKQLLVGGLDGRTRVLSYNPATQICDAATYLETTSYLPLTVAAGRATPACFDVTGDSIAEFVTGDADGNIWLYLADSATPDLWNPNPLKLVENANNSSGLQRTRTCIADVNDDGIPDILYGTADGAVRVLIGQPPANPGISFDIAWHDVEFDANGGETDAESLPYSLGYPFGQLPEATRTGHTFVGWFTASDEDGQPVQESTRVDDSINILYARWTANTYTVSFDPQDGAVTPATKTVTFNTQYGEFPIPALTGYSFGGWFTQTAGAGNEIRATNVVVVTGTQTLYAKWTPTAYTITYANTKGAGNTNPDSYTIEEAVNFTALPNVTGYTFAGWDVSAIALGSTGAKTITAQWTPTAYTITYAGTKGAANTNPGSYTIEDAVNFTALPNVTGYTFAGWDVSAIALGSTGAKTITAQWTPVTYTITYANTKGVPNTNPTSYTIEDSIVFNALADVTGYTFAGWNPVSIATGSTGNKTITAQWEANIYTLTFDAQGGTVTPGTQPVTYGAEYGELPVPVLADALFDGWWTEPNGGGTYVTNDTPVTITADQTLYANWDINSILGTTNLVWFTGGDLPWFPQSTTAYDGGTLAMQSGAITHEQSSWLATTLEGPGILSFRWGISAEANYDVLACFIDDDVVATLSSKTLNWESETLVIPPGEHTVYWMFAKDENTSVGSDAAWLDDVEFIRGIAITFDAQGGESDTQSMLFFEGESFTNLPLPVLEGYTFGGWRTEPDGSGFEITNNMPVTLDLPTVLYAYWTGNTYTLTLDPCGGIVTSGTLPINYGTPYGELPEPTFAEALFTGWWTQPNGGTRVTSATVVDTMEDHTLYAQWEINSILGSHRLIWSTGGDSFWFPQSDVAMEGAVAMQSGAIGDNQQVWLETTVYGPGTLTFSWRISSEGGYDLLNFDVNGIAAKSISGTKNTKWQHESFIFTDGEARTLRWAYTKDISYSEGLDSGWLDAVRWTPGFDRTQTTQVPVLHSWLDAHYSNHGCDYETLARSAGSNSVPVWHSFVAGLAPTNSDSRFTAMLTFTNTVPYITWDPHLGTNRKYTILGKASLTNEVWASPTNSATRFFKVKVEMPD